MKLSGLLAGNPATVAAGAELWTHKGHILGLQTQWVSGTAITVSTGSAYIESLGYAVAVSSSIAKSGLALSASTWYHLYLYMNAGAPDVELSTTAPVAYSGTARSKTGDSSRRYLRSVRTDGSGLIYKDAQIGNKIWYLENAGVAPFRVLTNGKATVATSVDLSGVVPITSNEAGLFAQMQDASATVTMGNSSTSFSLGINSFLAFVRPNVSSAFLMPTDSAQAIQYMCTALPAGNGALIYVTGYTFER